MDVEQILESALTQTGVEGPFQFSATGGGDTAISVKIATKKRHLFAKLHENADILKKEAAGLGALSAFVLVPSVAFCGQINGTGVLLMAFVPISPPVTREDWQELGDALAQLHTRSRREGPYGFDHDNFIGAMPQRNQEMSAWRAFFVRQRLAPQLAMACDLSPAVRERVAAVMTDIDRFLPEAPPAALLHGDLWSGNLGLNSGAPVFYDPACYYGDPQVDLAMMALFGKVPDNFYMAYQGRLPNSQERLSWGVYDLYHLLNHYNLFGAGYADAVGRIADQLLKY